MSNRIKPWRKADKKHFKRKMKFVKGKRPLPKLPVTIDTPLNWDAKIDIP
jgi:hypothetical protein